MVQSAQRIFLREPRKVYSNVTWNQPVVIAADAITLDNCTIDLGYEGDVGLTMGFKRNKRRYRGFKMTGGTVKRCMQKGIKMCNATLDGVTVEDCGQDGVFILEEGDIHIQNCTIKDYGWYPDAHGDGIQCAIGNNIWIDGNTIVNPHGVTNPNTSGPYGTRRMASNSCIFVEAQFGDVDGLHIFNNTLDGGLYTTRIRDEDQGFHVTRIFVGGNTYLRYRFGSTLYETEEVPTENPPDDFSQASQYIPTGSEDF